MTTNVPKFSSFRPKPKVASEPPKIPQHHDHSEQPSKDRSRRRSPSPSRKSREKQAPADKPYFSDRRGDADVLRYGTLNRYDIPPYRRYGHGFILGLSLHQKIDREHSTDKKISVTPAKRKRQQRLLIDKRANRSGERTLRLVQTSNDVADLNQDFVLLSTNAKRETEDGDGEDEETPETDYRGIEGPKSTEPADPDTQYESDAEIAIDVEVTRKNSELSRHIKEFPEDVSGWMALISHQEAMLKLERPNVELTSSDKAHLADIRITTYEEALRKIGKNPQHQLCLYKGLLKEAERAWDGAKLANKWKDVLVKHPDNVELWMMYLDFVQSRFTSFKYEECRAVFSKCIESLRTNTKHASPPALLHIFLRLTSMTHDAGYQELAIAVWQALLEIRIFRPEADASPEAFEAFWDSEVPRIGEPEAKGWKNYNPGDEALSLELAPLSKKNLSDSFFEDFQKRETEATEKLRLPGRTSEEVAGDDAFHTIFFDDVAPYLKLIPDDVPLTLLIEAFLCFCGLPPLSKYATHQRDWWSDPFLQRHWASSPPREEQSSEFTQTLQSFLNCPSGSFCMTTELLFDQSFSLEGIGLNVDFIRRLLKLLVSDPSSDDLFGEYLLAFELCHFPHEVFKTAKRLLKTQPSNLCLYNAYGIIEARLGNSEKADQAFRIVLSTQAGISAHLNAQALKLFHSWVWEALDRGKHKDAFWRLVSLSSITTANTTQDQPDERLVAIARDTFSVLGGLALSDQDYATAILSTSLSALLVYFTHKHEAEPALDYHSGTSLYLTSLSATSAPFAELHAQHIARLLIHHLTYAPIVKPALVRTTLEPLISQFPNNTILLSLYAANEARFAIDDRVRGVMQHSALHRPDENSIARWAFAIRYEVLRGEIAGSTSHSVRALYKRATDASGAHCPALWTAYLRFELAQLAQERSRQCSLQKPRRDSKKSKWDIRIEEAEQRVKDTFYAGLRHLPGCKGFAMLAFTEAKDVFGGEEMWRVGRILVEKEMRLYVDLDDDGAWETARARGWVGK
ncbi:DUF1740-domain-containing protein [Stemphylium lycopersici]|uniref:DUF1740-domain-containing protein n=1 Tax=Stemphylium lycopersici TaxID=183478 RepID=A0A364N4U9_STELY|nr:hypothetical protein TW65_08774 [Stemphylium lycopersici]RAR11845.1 DUF1740-domain-containing protein [Stemphylium lycopersici]RAR12003.1 DUF1740-domain-containing protein [Stemphylium lycopersici]